MSICSFPLYMFLSAFIGIFTSSGIGTLVAIAGVVIGIISLVQISKNNQSGKAKAIIGIVIGVICGFLLGTTYLSKIMFFDDPELSYEFCITPDVKDCVDNNDGTATCKYFNEADIICKTEHLKPEQYK